MLTIQSHEACIQTNWFVCMLHGIELYLKHYFTFLDGRTIGPSSYSGPIGKEINRDLSCLPIVQFNTLPGKIKPLPIAVSQEITNDQKYLYEASLAVQSGSLDPSLATKIPGKLHNARWLTLANRILRLYLSTLNPSEELCNLVHFLINFYVPAWFHVKEHWRSVDGSRNLHFIATLLKQLPSSMRDVVIPVFQRNAYFANPENILLSMITDEGLVIRKRAVALIQKARDTTMKISNTTNIREYLIPPIDINAGHYSELIDWDDDELILTEPPMFAELSNTEIEKIEFETLQIPDYVIHKV